VNADLSAFLERFRPDGYTTFVGIVPDGSTVAATFNGADPSKAANWIESQNRARGVYFTANPTPADLRQKPTKSDIVAIASLWGDVDPLDGNGRAWTAERERLTALAGELAALDCSPSFIVDSGNGIQPVWLLANSIESSPEYRAAAEALCARIEAALGAKGTHNVDRLLRVPGTRNLPNAKKRKLGRSETQARLLQAMWQRYSWSDLEELATRLEGEPPEHAAPVEYRERGYTNGHAVHLDGLPDYPTEEQIEALLENHPNLRAIWDQTTLYPPEDTSPSGWDQSFASTLAALGFPPERVAGYLRAYRARHSPEKGKQNRADYILRTVERAQPADAHLGDAQEPGDRPPDDAPPYQAGPNAVPAAPIAPGSIRPRAMLRAGTVALSRPGQRSLRRRTGPSPGSSASPIRRRISRPDCCRPACGNGSRRRPRTWGCLPICSQSPASSP
jgi:hypothetical protein